MFILNPLPDSHEESSEAPMAPGTEHGEYGPRLVITRTGGYSSSTATGDWRWCAKCGAWQKGVAIIGAMMCPKCHELWPNYKPKD
jgi:hypothetical protein